MSHTLRLKTEIANEADAHRALAIVLEALAEFVAVRGGHDIENGVAQYVAKRYYYADKAEQREHVERVVERVRLAKQVRDSLQHMVEAL